MKTVVIFVILLFMFLLVLLACVFLCLMIIDTMSELNTKIKGYKERYFAQRDIVAVLKGYK